MGRSCYQVGVLIAFWFIGNLPGFGQLDIEYTPGALASAEPPNAPDWTWKDRNGNVHTRFELDQILKQHQLWSTTNGKKGKQANLSGAKLIGVNLKGANLVGAQLDDVRIDYAIVRDADFSRAHLKGASFHNSGLDRSDFSGAHMDFAVLSSSHLDGALFIGTHLALADLSEAHLEDTDLTNAELAGANLKRSTLFDVDFTGADFLAAHLDGAAYEAKHAPALSGISRAHGLDLLSYGSNPGPLIELRKLLRDAGFVSESKQLTAAFRRHDQNVLEVAMFDWTCEWGADWIRPLLLLACLCLMCGPVYWVGMQFGKSSGIYQIELSELVATKAAKEIVTRLTPGLKYVGWRTLRERPLKLRIRILRIAIRSERKALKLAFLFSVLSALDIGFHEFNLGQWVRLLLTRDFNLKARGWMRVVGGVQSLLGLGLIALSLLSYFGYPFD